MTLALSVGILAAVWTWLTVSTFEMFHVVVWVTFISWAAFFIAGANKKAIMLAVYPLVSGTVLGLLCIVVMNLLFNGFNLPVLSL